MKNKKTPLIDIYDYDEALGDVLSILRDLYIGGHVTKISGTQIETSLITVLNSDSIKFQKNASLKEYKAILANALTLLDKIYNNDYLDLSSLDERLRKNLMYLMTHKPFENLL